MLSMFSLVKTGAAHILHQGSIGAKYLCCQVCILLLQEPWSFLWHGAVTRRAWVL
jgi:hypothetical protein